MDPLADSSLDRLRVAIRQEIETREKCHISCLEDSTSAAMEGEVFVPTAGGTAQTKISQRKTESITTMYLLRGSTPPREM